MTARDVLARVANRHTRDLWFPEVKDGPTIFGGHLRIDGLAIARTWSPPRITGYEVKVSRADWLQDSKWEAYLGLCHVLFVVAPPGVVQLEELPESVGLIETAGAKGLRTVRKAAYREIAIPADMLLYLLFSRAEVKKREWSGMSREARILHFRQRFETCRDGKSLGYLVAKATAERLEKLERGADVKTVDQMAQLQEYLSKHDPHGYGNVSDRLERIRLRQTHDLTEATRMLAHTTLRTARILRRLGERELPS